MHTPSFPDEVLCALLILHISSPPRGTLKRHNPTTHEQAKSTRTCQFETQLTQPQLTTI